MSTIQHNHNNWIGIMYALRLIKLKGDMQRYITNFMKSSF